MKSYNYLALLLIACVCIEANINFRGGYISYRIDAERSFDFDVTVFYSSAWKSAQTDCVGDPAEPSVPVTVSFTNTLGFQRSNPTPAVVCTPADNQNIRIGANSWTLTGLTKGTRYSLTYNIDSGWENFACCSNTWSSITGADSIVVDIVMPGGENNQLTSLNNPPMPSSLEIFEIPAGTISTQSISINDPEGNDVRCRLAATVTEGGAISQTNQVTINPGSGCSFTIDASSKAAGEYPVALMIEDFQSSLATAPLHSVPYQFVFVVTDSTASFPATVTCSPNNMRVSIPVSSFNANAVPEANRVTFTDDNCRAQREGSNFVLSTALNQCGTVYAGETNEHLVYENTVTARRDSSTAVTRQFEIRLKATCRYVRDQQSQGVKSFIANALISGQEENFGSFELDLKAYDSQFITAITNFPMNVELGARQYCQITVKSSNPDVAVVVERIFASNFENRDTLPHHDLILNRCPSDNTVQFNNIGATKDQFRFSFDAFGFTSDVTQTIYIHCDTFLCHQSSTDPRCLQQCPSDVGLNVNSVRRVGGIGRRSLDEQIDGAMNINEPSKIYFLVVGPYEKHSTSDLELMSKNKDATFWDKEHFIVLSCVSFTVFILVIAVFVFKLIQTQRKVAASKDLPFGVKPCA